jgi:hypothetical protein
MLIRNSFSDVTKSLGFFFLSFLCLFFISHFLVEIKVAFNEFYFDALTKISRRPDFSRDFVVVDSTELQFSTPIERERSFQDLLKKIKEDKPRLIYFILANSSLIQEEIFGPVVTIQKFKSFDEACALVNGTPYGLSCSAFTSNYKVAQTFAKAAKFGMVWINGWNVRDLNTPFGGMKRSGIGREGGQYSLDFFIDHKTTTWCQ